MPQGSLSEKLAQLDANPAPRAARFDDGPRLDGRVAVLPAAYNPPTLAHLHLLDLGRREPDVGSAAALLSTRNVDKGLQGATLVQRVEMLLELAPSEGIAVLATNQARLVDQSRGLEASFPGVEFDFIVGYDTFVRLFDDRYYEEMSAELAPFFTRHRLIATNRGPHSIDEMERVIREDTVAARFASRILLREIEPEPASFSSTAARSHAASGADLPQIPPAVAAYVRAHRLYLD